MKNVSADELRANSEKFRQEIKEYIKVDKEQIEKIKTDANASGLGAKEKEALYKQSDELEKKIDEKI